MPNGHGLRFGGMDCSRPICCALEEGIGADALVVHTDSETWTGPVHPVEVLRECRRKTGILAKLVVGGLVSNGSSIAGPSDTGMLAIVGFDTAAPVLIANLIPA